MPARSVAAAVGRCFVFWRLAPVTLRREATPSPLHPSKDLWRTPSSTAVCSMGWAELTRRFDRHHLQNGKIIYSQGYGAANLEYGVPNSPATVFPSLGLPNSLPPSRSASSSKMENCLWTTTSANTFRSCMTLARW